MSVAVDDVMLLVVVESIVGGTWCVSMALV
jgi:hypothetical protein